MKRSVEVSTKKSSWKRRVFRLMRRWGIDLLALRRALRESLRYRRNFRVFRESHSFLEHSSRIPLGDRWPVFGEDADPGGVASGAYFHQDLLVARYIFGNRPTRHVDVGSRIDGFVAHVASFRSIDVIDIRPIHSSVDGINFIQGDLTRLGPEWTGVADSVSCLHALEHFGLGRYGDALDPDGWLVGLEALTRLLAPEGTLYLSVPAGRQQRVEFNAHRVFSIPFMANILRQHYEVVELAFVDDLGNLHRYVPLESESARTSFNAELGCSIWVLRKRNLD